ncbi:MAG: hypothetical protein Q9225_006963 [Loekoesia sp. 1 TL-2023]
MVKVPLNARPSLHSLPYPVTPTSPSSSSPNPTVRAEGSEPSVTTLKLGQGSSMSAVARAEHPGTSSSAGRNDLPPALQVGQDSSSHWANEAPASLDVASSNLTPRSSSDSQRSQDFTRGSSVSPQAQPTNPYLRMKYDNLDASQPALIRNENSAAVWADDSARADMKPYTYHSQTKLSPIKPSMSLAADVPPTKSPFAEPWVDFKVSPEEQALFPTTGADYDRSNTQVPSDPWRQEQGPNPAETANPTPVPAVSYANELRELEAQPFKSASKGLRYTNADEKSLPPFPTDPSSLRVSAKAPDLAPKDSAESPDIPSPPPPRPQDNQQETYDRRHHSTTGAEGQQAKIKQQRNQTYQIRHVNWFDASSAVNPRRSPIMVQNANGPCPLLALVNALVLSTPADTTTGLVETLRVREQVSLGLLLDAVIDELMSGRRGDVAQNLPDVSDLYAFLINLHTGMNVNPRFVEPTWASTHLLDSPNDDAMAGSSDVRRAGGFEDTPFMRLYGTFAIPLIHGWLPRKNHPVCAAISRSATTYEDAQSLLFAEEDLENKLQTQGLTNDEQRLLQDITSVKHFLTTSPTQLTDYGLDTITETLRPGAVAILFRNDHFSTLYKQPKSGRIFTLVTDMGYAGHDEVVWESLVDISGEGSEFFSGDFRPVGNNVTSTGRSAGPSLAPDDAGWTTVSRSGGRGRRRGSPPNTAGGRTEQNAITGGFSQLSIDEAQDTIVRTNTEQEDHDLALAMQLQEEEEDRERQEVAARRQREDELSQAYLDSTSRSNQRGSRLQVPPRGGGARRAPPKKQTGDDDAPPPTYEQAAKHPAYHPPSNSLHHTQTPLRTNVDATGAQASRPNRQTSAYSQTNTAFANFNRHGPAMRRQQAEKKEEKDCIVM